MSRDGFERGAVEPLQEFLGKLDNDWATRVIAKVTNDVNAIPAKAKQVAELLPKLLSA